jgi:hypothetical protein
MELENELNLKVLLPFQMKPLLLVNGTIDEARMFRPAHSLVGTHGFNASLGNFVETWYQTPHRSMHQELKLNKNTFTVQKKKVVR